MAEPIPAERLREVMWFGPDGLLRVDTDHPAWSTVNRPAISPSLVNAMSNCRAMLVADKFLALPSGPFEANSLGSSAHAALEDMFGLEPPERTPKALAAAIDALPTSEHGLVLPEASDLPEWRRKVWSLASGEFAINNPADIRVVEREYALKDVTIGGAPVKGFIDRIDATDDGLRVVDYKTGKKPDEAKVRRFGDPGGDQQRMYVIGLRRAGMTVHSASLHYTAAEAAREVDLSAPALGVIERKVAEAWNALGEMTRTQLVPTSPGGLCNYCPLAKACPVSRASDARLADPVAKTGGDLGIETRRTLADVTNTDSRAQENVMAATKEPGLSSIEDKPFVEFVQGSAPGNVRLNLNSYAASHLSGALAFAYEKFAATGTMGEGASQHVMSLARFILAIEADAAQAAGVSSDFQSGATTRIRGLLRTFIEVNPLPFGQDVAVWEAYHKRAVGYLIGMLNMTMRLWGEARPGDLYGPLAAISG